MVNLNFVKECNGHTYQMKTIKIKDNSYVVEFSVSAVTTLKENTTTILAELTSEEMLHAYYAPDIVFELLMQSEVGCECYYVEAYHNLVSDPNYENIVFMKYSRNTIDSRCDWKSCIEGIDFDLDGCVVNTQSSKISSIQFFKNDEEYEEWKEKVLDSYIERMKSWESEHCYK